MRGFTQSDGEKIAQACFSFLALIRLYDHRARMAAIRTIEAEIPREFEAAEKALFVAAVEAINAIDQREGN